MKSFSFMLLAPLLVAACSSSGGGGGGPQGQSVAEQAKGTAFSQAAAQVLKSARAKSDAVMPDLKLITGATDSEKRSAESKLNTEGKAWLKKMQLNCRASTTGQAPEANGQGTTVVSIGGTDCPLTSRTTTVQTNNMSDKGGSIDANMTLTESVVDPALIASSGTRNMNTTTTMHADIAENSYLTNGSGAITVELVDSTIRANFKYEMAQAKETSSMAVAIHISTVAGEIDLGIVADKAGAKFYVGGREVTAAEFNELMGDFSPSASSLQ